MIQGKGNCLMDTNPEKVCFCFFRWLWRVYLPTEERGRAPFGAPGVVSKKEFTQSSL